MESLFVRGQVILGGCRLVVEIMALVVLPQVRDLIELRGSETPALSAFSKSKAEDDGLIKDFSIGIELNTRACSLGIPAHQGRGRGSPS